MTDKIVGGAEHADVLADNSEYRMEEQFVPVAGGPTLRVNAGFAANGQTIKNYTGFVATSATVATTITLETVTPGKTYVMTDLYMAFDDNITHRVRIQAAGVDIFQCLVKGDTAPLQMAGMESQPNASSGQLVTIVIPIIVGAPNLAFFVGGFEQ